MREAVEAPTSRTMRRLSILLAGLLGAVIGCTAQSPVFRNLKERDGLTHHDVRALCRDRMGALWIGTAAGLDRYDGARIDHIGPEEGMPATVVNALSCDANGVLWAATIIGLFEVDPITWKVHARPVQDVGPDAQANRMMRVQALHNGQVLCGTEDGYWLYDPATNSWRQLPVVGGTAAVRGIFMVPDSNGTGCWINAAGNGLAYYSATTDAVYGSWNNPAAHALLTGRFVGALHKDNDGSLWVSDGGEGVFLQYLPANGHLRRLDRMQAIIDKHFPYGIRQLFKDREGRLWLGGAGAPPVLVDLRDTTTTVLRNDERDPSRIAHHAIRDWYEDEQGLLWLATGAGVSVHDPASFQFDVIAPGIWSARYFEMNISSVVVLGSGAEETIWMGTEAGLVAYDTRTRGYRLVGIGDGDARVNAILGLTEVDGELWLATRRGVWAFDPRSGRSKRLDIHPKDDQEYHEQTYLWIKRDSRGRVWYYAPRIGLLRHDTRTKEAVPLADHAHGWLKGVDAAVAGDKAQLTKGSGLLHGMIEASNGHIWFCHDMEGLVWYDPAQDSYHSLGDDVRSGKLDNGTVMCVAEGAQGELWFFGLGTGLHRYVPGKGSYERFGLESGLPALSGWSIVPDRNGRLWLGTRRGLAVFDPSTGKGTRMRLDYGMDYNEPGHAAARLPSGEILMSNLYTLLRFDPSRTAQPRIPALPTVPFVRVGDTRVKVPEDGHLVLGHKQNQLALRFASFGMPGSVQRYALRGGEDEPWTEGDDASVTLSGLTPGEYTFTYRVRSDAGLWSEPGSLRVTVVPPWWQRLWARVLFALMIAAAIVLLFRLRLNLIRSRERKEESIARTVNDLKLRALRAQMNPHFVFNCMNSIDKYILMNEPEQASRYLNRFAKLVRLILNQSDRVSVPLDKEVEMLRYYLELEALRFEEPFTFEVVADPLLLNEDPELPAMLVQPYVENAIWHGLQHKHGRGHIRVDFRKLGNDLVVTVEDNGVGRAEAARIKAQRSTVHSSKAMQVNADRMRLMEELKLGGASVVIDDITDRDGKALGTRVTITLPLQALREGAWMEREEV